jgi:segregation and condensation protein A
LSVSLPEFSGPLDLLSSLIHKRRLDVTSVSLAAVADQYLEQVLALEGELEALSEFLQLGSQLLLIKSRALLLTPHVEGEDEDPAEELRRRLAEYEILRVAAQWLAEREVDAERTWPRGMDFSFSRPERPLAPVTPARLAALAEARRVGSNEELETVEVRERPSLRARAEVLLGLAARDGWVSLDGVLGDDVPTIVASFLALLVLTRRGVVEVKQDQAYGLLAIRRLAAEPVSADAFEDWSGDSL